MTPDELDAAIDFEMQRDARTLQDVFGNQAERYRRLQKKANGTLDPAAAEDAQRQVDAMESKLTPEQEKRLFGYGETGPQLDELKDTRRALQDLDTDNEARLGRSLGRAITDIGDAQDPEQMSPRQRLAYAQLRHANQIIGEKGMDEAKVMEAAVKTSAARFSDPADAEFMLRRWLKPGQQPAQKKGPRVDAGLTNGGSPKQLPPPEAATPRAPAFTVTPGTPPVKAQPRAPQPRPQRTPFTRAMLERKLVDYHEQVGGGYTAADEKALSEAGTGATGESAFTFAHHLPGEIKHYIENNPAARRLFRVTSDPTKAGGEDAMSDLGERYWHIVDSRAGNSVKLAKETIRKSGDPAMQFWSAVHDNLPAAKERPAQGAVDPAELAVGQEFELNGAKFQVHEDENGLRVLKDGDEYPEVPVDALAGQKIPVDTGTLKQGEEPPVPRGISRRRRSRRKHRRRAPSRRASSGSPSSSLARATRPSRCPTTSQQRSTCPPGATRPRRRSPSSTSPRRRRRCSSSPRLRGK
jgi:hypothetical protein